MGKIYTSVEQLIGGTPLLELGRIQQQEGLQATLLAKLEYLNPAGSAKDRVARAMVDDAEAMGADAVINIRYGSSAVMQGAAEVIAYGTAVRFK